MREVIFALLCALLVSAGCRSLPALGDVRPDDISEIHLKIQTGLAGASADFIVRRDGSAELTCNFYRLSDEGLTEDSGPVRAIPVCGKLFLGSPNSFEKMKNSYGGSYLRGFSKATASQEQFSRLADLIVRNGYFSMEDRYEVPGLMDAPPDITRVVYSGGEKEISNQNDKGGPKLGEIQKNIYALLGELDWLATAS